MTVTDDQVATLRAVLSRDSAAYEPLRDRLDRTDGWKGYTVLVAAAFFEAVDRRFGAGWSEADIVNFVADVRARHLKDPDVLDPRVAERLILHALGKGSISDLDDGTVAGGQAIVLRALVADEDWDDAQLDDFMRTSRALGDRLMELRTGSQE